MPVTQQHKYIDLADETEPQECMVTGRGEALIPVKQGTTNICSPGRQSRYISLGVCGRTYKVVVRLEVCADRVDYQDDGIAFVVQE